MQNEVVIRQDKLKLIMVVVILTLTVAVVIGVLIDQWEIAGYGILLIIFVGAVFLGLLIYLIKELYERKVEMAISHEGVYLRNGGLYPWSLIESFSTEEDDGMVLLVLHFEKYADETIQVSSLEYDKKDIIDLMLAYKGTSAVYYTGHKKR
jgi:hypothetical protein